VPTVSRPASPFAYIAIGLVAGLFSGFFGVGGGIIMIPLLMIALRFDQRQASITSLTAIIPTATFAAVTFLASGYVPWDQVAFGFILAIGSTLTAPLGSWALRTWNVRIVRWFFIGLLALSAIVVFVTLPDRSVHLEWSVGTVAGLVVLGCVMGFVAGLLGVGGGLIVVPVLIVVFGVSDLTAKALSLVAMVPTSISGTLGSHRAGLVNWRNGFAIGIPASLASPVGVWLAGVVPVEWAEPMLTVLMIYAVTQMSVRTIVANRRERKG
jgi:uncharacterized membrane protein YfcA